jgi:ABC-2 type transport system permease protein
VLAGRRDVGAGLVRPRRGPASAAAWLCGPAALVLRLQRGTLAGWTAALAALGLTFGSLAESVTRMVGDNPRLAQVVGASGDLTDGFSAAAGTYSGLAAAGFAVAAVLRARGEEQAGRTELLLAAAVDRRRLLGAVLRVAGGGALVLLAVFGLADGLAASAALGTGRVGPQLAASLVQLPAVLVVAGAAAALVGGAPRQAPLAWLLLAWSLVVGLLGPLLQLPGWALHLSPFSWVPRVPAEPADAVPLLGLTAVAVAFGLAALAAFRHRDVPT